MKLDNKDYNSKIRVYFKGEFKNEIVTQATDYFHKTNQDLNLIKSEKGRVVFKIKINNKDYYIKRYSYRKLDKRIKNLFRPPEAVRAFKTSIQLMKVGIPVVKPVLALTYQKSLTQVDSIFITEGFEGIDLEHYLVHEECNYHLKGEILKRLAQLLAIFFKCKFTHGDLNLGGVLVKFEQSDFKINLVDVDNIKKFPWIRWKAILKNLVNFNAHIYSRLYKFDRDYLDYNDRIEFFEEFINYYDESIDFNQLMNLIDEKTANKLISWNKSEIVISNKNLNEKV